MDKEKRQNHTNGIEGFWSFAKERIAKHHGVKSENFESYSEEIEFRYNYREIDTFEQILRIHYEGILH